jgi:hypothetical protein
MDSAAPGRFSIWGPKAFLTELVRSCGDTFWSGNWRLTGDVG